MDRVNSFLTEQQVAQGRVLLAKGWSLHDAAKRLNTRYWILDRYLWAYVGKPITLMPGPMF